MDISTLDLKGLKALAYDVVVELEKMQKNLATINNEIARKLEAEKEVTQPKPKPTKK